MTNKLKITLFFICSFILASCAPFTRNEQSGHSELIRIGEGEQVGQTFLAGFDGLHGISVYFKPIQIETGEIFFELFSDSNAADPIRISSLPLSEISTTGFYNFTFPPVYRSTNEDYFFKLTIDGPGIIEVGSAPGNSYLSGAQYTNGVAQNSQSSFRLNYASGIAIWGLIRTSFSWIGILFAGLFLIALPGWGVLLWLYPPWSSLNWISRFGLALGTGLAFYPVLFLWSNTLGIQLGLVNALLLPISGLFLIVIRIVRDNRKRNSDESLSFFRRKVGSKANQSKIKINWGNLLPDLVFILVIALVLFTRFWPIRNLDAPMWGDSYQHTMIAQLLVDNGGLFTNWQPYAQLESFTYHFGFHSLAASIHWLTNLSVIQATLWTGQLLNIFAIITLYPLAVTVGKSRWAGVIAVLIAGLLSPMPMYYINWGRYTQLAGQIILPASIVIIWMNLKSKQFNLKWNALIWFCLAGLALTHYRVTIFIPLFYISFFIFQYRQLGALNLLKRTLIHLIGVVILLVPWGLRILEGSLPNILGTQIATAASQVSQATQQLNSIGIITSYLPLAAWILLGFSIVWGFWKRNRESNIYTVWWLFILLAANPQWLGIPGTGILTNFAVFIGAYIPASVIIGSGVASVLSELRIVKPQLKTGTTEADFAPGDSRNIFWIASLSIVLVLAGIWFVRPRSRDVQPLEHALLTRPDVEAGEWINQNLPPEAKLLVNSFFAYGGTLVVGSDGGWWLPLIAGRQTSQPPLTYGSERGLIPEYVELTNNLVALIEEKGINHIDVLAELRKRGFSHIYIGQQQGQVNANSPALLNLTDLQGSPNFELIYKQDRVRIFKIVDFEGKQ